MKLPSWLTTVRYRLSGSAYSAMEIPPDWSYEQYLRVYGQVGWLFGAVSLIANSVAEVPWHLYRLGAGGKKEELDSHPLLDLWAYMNPFQTRYQFTELLQMYLSLVGEAFIVLNYNRLGQPAEAWLAPPQYMVIVPSRDKYISHYEYQREGNVLRLEIPEVIHVFSPNPQNPYRGIAPAHAISTDLDTERFSARYQQRVFYNDGMPGMMIEYPDVPPKEERDKIRAEWNEIHRGWRNARKTGFLWGGAKAHTLAISNKDMEYYNLRHVNRDVILGAYHIPGSLMGIAEIGSRARAEADEYIYAKYTVRPALTRLREALNEQLVPQFGPDLHFEFDDPVPQNRVEQVDEAAKLVPIGVITREEARRKLGYGDKPASGETLLAPLTLLPETVKAARHTELNRRAFSEEEKQARWEIYKAKSERDEAAFRRLFSDLWTDQAGQVASAYEQVQDLAAALREEAAVEAWQKAFQPLIQRVFEDAWELSVGGGQVKPAHRGKQGGVLNPRALEWIFNRSLALAKLVNGTTRMELQAELGTAFEAGESVPQIVSRIRDYYANGYERRATLVARTEVIAASNEGALNGYQAEGVQKAEFYVAMDERTCDECLPLNGRVYPVDESHGMIPVHPQCRCVWLPVTD